MQIIINFKSKFCQVLLLNWTFWADVCDKVAFCYHHFIIAADVCHIKMLKASTVHSRRSGVKKNKNPFSLLVHKWGAPGQSSGPPTTSPCLGAGRQAETAAIPSWKPCRHCWCWYWGTNEMLCQAGWKAFRALPCQLDGQWLFDKIHFTLVMMFQMKFLFWEIIWEYFEKNYQHKPNYLFYILHNFRKTATWRCQTTSDPEMDFFSLWMFWCLVLVSNLRHLMMEIFFLFQKPSNICMNINYSTVLWKWIHQSWEKTCIGVDSLYQERPHRPLNSPTSPLGGDSKPTRHFSWGPVCNLKACSSGGGVVLNSDRKVGCSIPSPSDLNV